MRRGTGREGGVAGAERDGAIAKVEANGGSQRGGGEREANRGRGHATEEGEGSKIGGGSERTSLKKKEREEKRARKKGFSSGIEVEDEFFRFKENLLRPVESGRCLLYRMSLKAFTSKKCLKVRQKLGTRKNLKI